MERVSGQPLEESNVKSINDILDSLTEKLHTLASAVPSLDLVDAIALCSFRGNDPASESSSRISAALTQVSGSISGACEAVVSSLHSCISAAVARGERHDAIVCTSDFNLGIELFQCGRTYLALGRWASLAADHSLRAAVADEDLYRLPLTDVRCLVLGIAPDRTPRPWYWLADSVALTGAWAMAQTHEDEAYQLWENEVYLFGRDAQAASEAQRG